MIRSLVAALAVGVLLTAAAAQGQVEYTVIYDPDDNTFELFADVAAEGNAGLAGFTVNWNESVVTSAENLAPRGTNTSFVAIGFTVGNTAHPQLFSGQNSTVPASLVYGIGQAPGTLPDLFEAAPSTQPTYGAPVLLATGNYIGSGDQLVVADFFAADRGQVANVWTAVGATTSVAADVSLRVEAIPEPAALSLLVLGGVGLMARRRAA